ncbi:MAG TPA: hypothetical protein VKW04_13315 [Planctomycetota bacterium]|nr:hypothetical protein [Planctomycetota bacterium]
MSDSAADQVAPFLLTCPECGSSLKGVPDNEEVLCCPSHHRFTLPGLIVGQSRRASALCDSATRLLEEQERLVRQIAKQLWDTQTLTAFRLEGRADRLRETLEAIRTFIREDFMGHPKEGNGDELSN